MAKYNYNKYRKNHKRKVFINENLILSFASSPGQTFRRELLGEWLPPNVRCPTVESFSIPPEYIFNVGPISIALDGVRLYSLMTRMDQVHTIAQDFTTTALAELTINGYSVYIPEPGDYTMVLHGNHLTLTH